MSKKKRRPGSAEDTLRIVHSGREPDVEVSELCRREGINPTQYDGWKKVLLSSAARVFDTTPQKSSRREERLEGELARYKNVIAEITAENLELKRTLSD